MDTNLLPIGILGFALLMAIVYKLTFNLEYYRNLPPERLALLRRQFILGGVLCLVFALAGLYLNPGQP